MKTECEACRMVREQGISHEEALERIGLKDAHSIEFHGWTGHIIADSPYAHTHGLPESCGHPDVEVRLACDPDERGRLLGIVAGAVTLGRRFADGQEARDLFSVPVRLVTRLESGREVLRVVFPDVNGRWPGEGGCAPGYDEQLLQE